jgi:hypothetical protein
MHAVWSNSEVDEDERYQRVLHSVSEDRVHWSKPETLFEPTPSGGVWTAAGLYVYGDALNAYAGYYEYKPETAKAGCYTLEHHNTGLFVRTTRNGADWSDLRDLGIPIVPNHGPQRVASGRLIISGNIVFPYTDDPGGQTGWKPVGLPPFPWQNWYDDSEGFWKHYKEINWDQWLCEGSFYQLDNGKLCMLLRSNQKRLFLSESTDSGETWSKPIPTDFTDCGTKFHCGRLPDGRFYVVGNPDPASNRCPLVVTLSKDGEVFNREFVIDGAYRSLRNPGRWKGGIYGYPHTLIDSGRMYVVCSVNKEGVFVYDFSLDSFNQNVF